MLPNREGIIVSPTEPAENRRKVWIQKGKNLFDKNNAIVIGKFLYEGGQIASDEDLFYQDNYIDVKANTEYVISATNAETFRILEYDKNKTYIRRDVNANANTSYNFTTSLNCCFIKISCSISNLENIQLEQGTTATEYEEYIEHKTYILNDNNVYEEFMKKEDTGWIDINLINATSFSWAKMQYRKIGKIIYVCGGMTITDTTPEKAFCHLPPAKNGIPVLALVNPSSAVEGFYLDGNGNLIIVGALQNTSHKQFYFNFSYIAK